MRIVPFIISTVATAGLVFVLNTSLPLGKTKSPRLGYFLSPQQGFWQNAEATNSSFTEEIKIKGIRNKVDVFMDERLVPHIYAQTDLDAYYVQGFIHAKFRLWQMEFQTYVAGGRLSEILGSGKSDIDQFFRRLGMVYGAEQTMQRMEKDREMQATVDAYSEGVNAYIKSLKPEQIPFEYKLLDYQPEAWTPLKTYLFLMYMSYDLTGSGAKADLKMTNAKNYFGYDEFNQLFPNIHDSLDPIIPKGTAFLKPSIVPVAPKDVDSPYLNKSPNSSEVTTALTPNKNNGSNNWAVAGSKTVSGRPILCNDPHLGLNLPSIWYEMQINTPTHNTYGASFPGSPAVIIGFNDSIAWGVTNAGRDVLDYYDVQFKDTSMQEYWYNGAWKTAELRTETIKVKAGTDLHEYIAMTEFGPVMYDHHYKNDSAHPKYLAVRWTANTAGNGLKTFYKLNRAKNFEDYQNAIAEWSCPGQNFAFASKSGDIAIRQQGAFVARWNRQGDFIMPGLDSTYKWQGMIPENENPMIKNPARGWVSSANQMATDSSYPYYLGTARSFPLYRGIMINRRLAAMNDITAIDMQYLQMENYDVFAEMARPVILKNIDENKLTVTERKYIGILRDWNFRNEITAQGATVFKAIWDSLEQVVWKDDFQDAKNPLPWPESSTLLEGLLRGGIYRFADNISTKDKVETIQDDVMEACKKASVYLEKLEKERKLDWGTLKDTRVAHLLQLPALSRLHLPIGGGKDCINATTENHGPSWRMIVHLTDEIEAYGVYPGGQSGNPGSKFYDNFIDSWAAGKYYKLLFLSKDDISKNQKTKWHITFVNG
ncbi:MAG: penicillin acylase family protein [Chitinophagaceae bacterium]|nr:penicillin acylase family protein [Chitinophagaceae bacterium]